MAAAAIARLCNNAASAVAADTDNDKCDGCKPLLFRAATAAAVSPGWCKLSPSGLLVGL